jgi:PD-(D/E)XK endonuclease
MPTPSTKGSIAEAVIAGEAIKLGVVVLRPLLEGRRYDLMFDVDGLLLRVQCKWACRKGHVIVVNIRTSRLTPRGYVSTRYAPSEVDAIAAYCAEVDECYLLPIEDVVGKSVIHLRLTPAANGQELAIRYAEPYRLSGAIAQLGERRAGSAKVEGSSPSSSTREAA